jgi:large subunit ribosomal protein L3
MMLKSLLGYKLKQTQEFTSDGRRVPVTYIQAGPCFVTGIITDNTHTRIQLGFGMKKTQSKAESGHINKAGLNKKLRFLREFPMETGEDQPKSGSMINVGDVFAEGDSVTITGTSKGKGFAGVVKRHNFRGGPRTHGQSDRERAPGSIGQTTTPGRVYRGKRMAGRMGTDRVTIKGLTVLGVDPQSQTMKIKGLIPGPIKGMVIMTKIK